MLNERQDGFINELKETYEKLNEQSQPNGNFNIIDVSVFQDYANKFEIRRQEIVAENKAVLDGYMEKILRDAELLNEDLRGSGMCTRIPRTESGKHPSNIYVVDQEEWEKIGSSFVVYQMNISKEYESNLEEDRNLPDSLVKVVVKDNNGIRGESIKDLAQMNNFGIAVRAFLRSKAKK
jgi:hypothetical protein